MQISQILAMGRYEFWMHLRRPVWVTITLVPLIYVLLSLLLLGDNFQSQSTNSGEGQAVLTAAILFITWSPLSMLLIFILPIMVSDVIPLDHQHNMRELLDTLPLTPATYLMGKLAGMWAMVLAALSIVMLLSGVGWRLRLGAYDLGSYLQMWVIGVATLVILNGSIGVLINAGLSTRRRAILLSVVVMILSFRVFGAYLTEETLLGIVSPLRGPILSYYLFNTQDVMKSTASGMLASQLTTLDAVYWTIVAGVFELIALFGLVLLWLRWQQSRT